MNEKNLYYPEKGERLDDLHRNGYKLIQNKELFCFGVDAVLLSGFAKVKKGDTVLDIGTGNGVIPILLEGKTNGKHFTGVEVQKKSFDLAKRNISLNCLEDKINIINDDIKNFKKIITNSSFNVVVSNPPYMNGKDLLNDTDEKTIARHEILCGLEDIIKAASWSLNFGGRFYIIHKPHRMTDIFYLLRKYDLEPKVLRLVLPKIGKPPTMILIEAKKGGNSWLDVMQPLVIYDENGEHTEEVLKIYYSKSTSI